MRLALLVLTAIVTVSFSQPASADVHSRKQNATHYVRVTPVNGLVRFEYCDKANTDCKLLGKRDYSLYELRHLRGHLVDKGAAVLVIDTALVAGAAIYGLGGGAVLAAWVGVTSTNGLVLSAYAGSAWAMHSTGHMLKRVRVLNPLRRLREARSIRGRVVTDKDASVYNIEKYAARLNSTLLLLN